MNPLIFDIDSSTLQRIGLLVAIFLALIVVSFVAAYAINRVLRRWLKTGALFIAGATQTAIILAGIYQIALYSGANPTVILAVVAIISAGISLSADNMFASFMGGLQIVLSDRFSIEDQVTIGDVRGVIKSISLLTTTVQANDLGIIVLSNRNVADSQITNHTRLDGIELSLIFPMYDAHSIAQAKKIINDAIVDHPGIKLNPKILHGWDNGSERYAVVVRVIEYAKRRDVVSDLSIRITEALRSEGLPLGSVNFLKNI